MPIGRPDAVVVFLGLGQPPGIGAGAPAAAPAQAQVGHVPWGRQVRVVNLKSLHWQV